MLNIAKLDKDKVSLNKETVSLYNILDDVKENFDFNQATGGGQFTIVKEIETATLIADPVHLTNVLFNLVDNAVKYCKVTPQIQVMVKADLPIGVHLVPADMRQMVLAHRYSRNLNKSHRKLPRESQAHAPSHA